MLKSALINEISMTINNKSERINQPIINIQFSVDQLSVTLIEMLDDVDRFMRYKTYQEEYQHKIQPIITNFAEKTFGAMSFYVRFNPKYSPGTSGLFYADTNDDGEFEKQIPTDFSKYKPDDLEHVGWYYIPIKNKKSTWLHPYYNANIKANMISYVVPIYKEDETIGIVGMDINFDKFENIISENS